MSCFNLEKHYFERLAGERPRALENAKSLSLETHVIFVRTALGFEAVEAIKENKMYFRILDENVDDEHNPWQFNCLDLVECVWHYFSEDDEPDLLANKKLEDR